MGLLLLQGASDLNPRELFANGEQGLWLDPSDMTAGKAAWRRNLLTYSEQFDNSAWTKNNGTITANSTASPFGETTADTITQSGGTVLAFVERSITLINPINQTYTLSVYAKKNTLRDYLLIEERWSGASQRTYFDIASGTVLVAAGTHTAQIQNIGSGWYRCSVTFTVTTGATTSIFIGPSGAGTITVPADGGSMFLFGAQLELGSTTSEYQRITDFSTEFKAAFPTHALYQDSNGVTPCTAAGDPVGLILDQSRGGLSQIGADLVTNGTFAADTDWTKGANWTIGSGVATKTGGAANNLTQTIGSTAAAWYRISLDVTRSAGTLTISLGTSGTTYAITATGSYTFFILAGSGTQTLTLAGDSSFAGTVDNVVVRNVPGNHAYQTTSAARPTLQTTSGLWYLSFDGSDDSLVTNAVDFTATDEMTVIAGVRKLSDAAVGMIAELTASLGGNNGSFAVFTPNTPAAATYSFGSKGTNAVIADTSSGFAAPLTNVLTLQADISSDSVTGRINAAQVATSSSDQGSGNYSNAAIYIGRRGGTTFPYNGHLYQLIVRGKTTPTGKLLEAERFAGKKTGVSF